MIFVDFLRGKWQALEVKYFILKIRKTILFFLHLFLKKYLFRKEFKKVDFYIISIFKIFNNNINNERLFYYYEFYLQYLYKE